MVHQMAQEGALWPIVMIRFGPHWCNSKITEITWANIVNVVIMLPIYYVVGAALAQP